MRIENIYNKLSSSAKSTLNEYLEDIKEEILIRAEKEALKEDVEINEIRLKELISAIKISESTNKKSNITFNKRKRFYSLMSLMGIMYALIGIAYYLYQNKLVNIEKDIGIILAIGGVMVSFLSYFMSQYATLRTEREKREKETDTRYLKDRNYELLKRWQVIESQARKIAEHDILSSDRTKSVSNILKFLFEYYTFDNNERAELRELLNMRNKIIHEDAKFSESEISDKIEFSNKIIDRLDKKLK